MIVHACVVAHNPRWFEGVDKVFSGRCKLASLCVLKCLFEARGCNFDPVNLKFSGHMKSRYFEY